MSPPLPKRLSNWPGGWLLLLMQLLPTGCSNLSSSCLYASTPTAVIAMYTGTMVYSGTQVVRNLPIWSTTNLGPTGAPITTGLISTATGCGVCTRNHADILQNTSNGCLRYMLTTTSRDMTPTTSLSPVKRPAICCCPMPMSLGPKFLAVPTGRPSMPVASATLPPIASISSIRAMAQAIPASWGL